MSDERALRLAAKVIDSQNAELAVWRRHGVLITEDCGSTASHPECRYLAVCLDGTMHCNKCGFTDTHARCDGSGKQLKDGAEMRYAATLNPTLPPMVLLPASWLEGASDE